MWASLLCARPPALSRRLLDWRTLGTAFVEQTPDRIAGMFDAIAPRTTFSIIFSAPGSIVAGARRRSGALPLTGRDDGRRRLHRPADVALEARRDGPRRGGPGRGGPGRGGGASGPPTSGAARVLGIDFAGAMLDAGRAKVRAAGEEALSRSCVAMRCGCRRAMPARTPRPWRSGFATCSSRRWPARRWRRPSPGDDWPSSSSASPHPRRQRAVSLVFHVRPAPYRSLISRAYWCLRVPPGVGRHVSPAAEFVTLLRQAGFSDVRAVPLTCWHRLSLHGD